MPPIVGIQATVESMNTSVNKRYRPYLKNFNCIISTYLDPRWKEFVFFPDLDTADHIPEQELDEIVKKIKETYIRYYEAQQREKEKEQSIQVEALDSLRQ